MTVDEIIISIIIYIFGIAQTSIFPFFAHGLWAKEIDLDLLKTIKLKRFKFLFRGYKFNDYSKTKYADIENYGLPIPIFIEQISAYILTIIYIAGMIILGVLMGPKYMVAAPLCIGIFSIFYECALILISRIYCKSKKKTNN